MDPVSIVWFRRDLRLADNPALDAAVKLGGKVIPLFVWAPEEEGAWAPGGASKWWLHHSLVDLSNNLAEVGAPLVVRQGNSLAMLREVAKEVGATHLFWNRLYEPEIIKRDTQIKKELSEAGLTVVSSNGALLIEPWELLNQSGKPFQVFTPYWRAVQKILEVPESLLAPTKISGIKLAGLEIQDLKLLPNIRWDRGLMEEWKPGESFVHEALAEFIQKRIGDYKTGRDIPSIIGTSRLSPRLHFGEVSPRQIWNETQAALRRKGGTITSEGAETYLREIGWREFAHQLLFHFPHTPERPLRENFKVFPWISDSEGLAAWKKGVTGYPIVDAGMRELWHTGWMHNRVRMIVSSFLVKDLLISWNEGASWFWDTLVDASLANNTLGWQWSGGCGADAAPFFRIFNPTSQGEKFDPQGLYVRKWIPELTEMPDKWLHCPWEAPEAIARQVKLGEAYPYPIVNHKEARDRALMAFEKVKG